MLGDPSTYQHPLIPEDIFLDKSSLIELLNTSDFVAPESSSSSSEDSQEIEKPFPIENDEEFDEVKEPEGVMTVTEVRIDVCLSNNKIRRIVLTTINL